MTCSQIWGKFVDKSQDKGSKKTIQWKERWVGVILVHWQKARFMWKPFHISVNIRKRRIVGSKQKKVRKSTRNRKDIPRRKTNRKNENKEIFLHLFWNIKLLIKREKLKTWKESVTGKWKETQHQTKHVFDGDWWVKKKKWDKVDFLLRHFVSSHMVESGWDANGKKKPQKQLHLICRHWVFNQNNSSVNMTHNSSLKFLVK